MNAERLHAIADAIRDDFKETNVTSLVEELTTTLQNIIDAPQEGTYQKKLRDLIENLRIALTGASSNDFPPTWRQALEELGAADLFGTALLKQIDEIFARNQITPAVANEELSKLNNRLEQFQNSINEMRGAFTKLGIGEEELQPGTAELGLLIPREFVNNKLDGFAKELKEDDRIFGAFSEVATGSRPGFKIHSISSSALTVFLELVHSKTAACIATAVAGVIGIYKTLLDIRKLKAEAEEKGLPAPVLKGFDEHADSLMTQGIDDLVERLLAQYYQSEDGGRRNELKIELKYSLHAIAGRIDRGFNIEVRAKRSAEESEEQRQANDEDFAAIQNAKQNLEFLKAEGTPILTLPAGKPDVKTNDENADSEGKRPRKK